MNKLKCVMLLRRDSMRLKICFTVLILAPLILSYFGRIDSTARSVLLITNVVMFYILSSEKSQR